MSDYKNQQDRIVSFLNVRGKSGVANWEFPSVLRVLSYSRRITDINKDRREQGLPEVLMLREWEDGKATGTYVYFLPKSKAERDQIIKNWNKAKG